MPKQGRLAWIDNMIAAVVELVVTEDLKSSALCVSVRVRLAAPRIIMKHYSAFEIKQRHSKLFETYIRSKYGWIVDHWIKL